MPNDHLTRGVNLVEDARALLDDSALLLDARLTRARVSINRAITGDGPRRDAQLGDVVVESLETARRLVRAQFDEMRLAVAREKRELEAALHEYEIMFSRHCMIKYPKAHPAIRRPTREPSLPAGMRYVDVSHLSLRPDELDVDSGRERNRNVCHLVGPLAAYAHRQPDLLLNCVRLDRGKVVVTVPGGQYRLDPTLPADEETGALTGIEMAGGHTLMAFVEKAFAAEHGGYEQLEYRSPSDAMSWLGGRLVGDERTRDFTLDELKALLSHPERVLTTGTVGLKFAELATDAELARKYKAPVAHHAGHAFTLRHVDIYGRVHLRNTWGEQDPDPVPFEDFPRVFPHVYWEAIYGDPPPPSMRVTRI